MLTRENLHEYQRYCVDYLKSRPAAGLFIDLGLGKTVTTLTAIADLMYDNFDVRRVLVIAPLRVAASVWVQECAKWEHLHHLRVCRVLGSAKQRQAALDTDADIYVINRENVEWLVNFYRPAWPFDLVVIDELSSFKSPQARRFKALRKVRPLIRRLWGLTGTPSPNGLIDLWPQLYLLDRGERLGRTVGAYRAKYFAPGRRNGYVVYDWHLKPGAEDDIYLAINNICVSMKAVDYITLPERVDVVQKVVLDGVARTAYEDMAKETMLMLSDSQIIDAASAAVVTGKLMQLANGAIYSDDGSAHEIHAAKLDALEDVIDAANGRPLLVFYAYLHDRDRIKARFSQARTLDSEQEIAEWNAGNIPLLLAHPAGAGHGLNLQAGGDTVVWFGLTWSLELYQQANARIYRQGVRGERVTIVHLVAENTVDEDVMEVLAGKASRQDALLAAVKAELAKHTKGLTQGEDL